MLATSMGSQSLNTDGNTRTITCTTAAMRYCVFVFVVDVSIPSAVLGGRRHLRNTTRRCGLTRNDTKRTGAVLQAGALNSKEEKVLMRADRCGHSESLCVVIKSRCCKKSLCTVRDRKREEGAHEEAKEDV